MFRTSLRATVASVALLVSGALAQDAVPLHEAPALQAMVDSGELPPLAERLPSNPRVVSAESIGSYGGELRMNGLPSEVAPIQRLVGSEMLFRFDNEGNAQPNLVASYEVNDDSTVYTLHLREGVRWSDGELFTADDVLFWFNDIALNAEFNPGLGLNGWYGGLPANWRSIVDDATVAPKMTKIDDTTIQIAFPVPNGAFVIGAASWENDIATRLPVHYLRQFHPAYGTDVAQLVSAGGFPNWQALMRAKMDWWTNSEVPTLNPWTLNAGLGSAAVVNLQRNPWYWKIDAEGNQLPYIDSIRWQQIEDNEIALLRTLGGEVDWKFATAVNIPDNQGVLLDSAEAGNYRLVQQNAWSAVTSFDFNLTSTDPTKRSVFSEIDFRIGFSHAIDRNEINDLVYLGQNEPQQFAPTPGSPLYNEEFATQYLEHDLELANSYLDHVLPQKDADGFRLGPDGKRFTFSLQSFATNAQYVATLELMERQLERVGLDVVVDPVEPTLMRERVSANQYDTFLGGTTTGLFPVVLYFNPFPIYTWPNNDEYNALLWSNWYLGITPSEVPPEPVRAALAVFDELKTVSNPDRQLELARQIIDMSQDLFLTLGIVRNAPNYAIANSDLRNIQEPIASQPFVDGTLDPETWFFDR